jgi:hypothetical protein
LNGVTVIGLPTQTPGQAPTQLKPLGHFPLLQGAGPAANDFLGVWLFCQRRYPPIPTTATPSHNLVCLFIFYFFIIKEMLDN